MDLRRRASLTCFVCSILFSMLPIRTRVDDSYSFRSFRPEPRACKSADQYMNGEQLARMSGFAKTWRSFAADQAGKLQESLQQVRQQPPRSSRASSGALTPEGTHSTTPECLKAQQACFKTCLLRFAQLTSALGTSELAETIVEPGDFAFTIHSSVDQKVVWIPLWVQRPDTAGQLPE